MLDVLAGTGTIWQTLLRSEDAQQFFRVRIVSPDGRLFTCGNRIPVNPDCAVGEDPDRQTESSENLQRLLQLRD